MEHIQYQLVIGDLPWQAGRNSVDVHVGFQLAETNVVIAPCSTWIFLLQVQNVYHISEHIRSFLRVALRINSGVGAKQPEPIKNVTNWPALGWSKSERTFLRIKNQSYIVIR